MSNGKHFLNLFLFSLLATLFNFNIGETSELRLKLIPWDSPSSPFYPGNLTPLQKYKKIIKYTQQMESFSNSFTNATINLNKIQVPMKHQQNFRYSINIKIGALPGKEVTLLVDTGSGFVWTECVPGLRSYQPIGSRTYKMMPCNHRLCAKKICKCHKKRQCVCTILYGSHGEKLVWQGSIDSFHIPIPSHSEKSFHDIVFGCSNKQPLNLSGILGLDRTPVSLISQLRSQTQRKFSYCLHYGDSYLTLGKDIGEEMNVKTTPLIHTEYSTLFLNLTDISVEGKRLGLSPSLFSLKKGGVFMDTGVQYTVLTRKAYDKVSIAFKNHFKGRLERTNMMYMSLQPCYRLRPNFNDYPTMTFHFQGADLVVDYTHVVLENITCMAVVPGRRTIIGALQQWNNKLMFDLDANLLKFYKTDCDSA